MRSFLVKSMMVLSFVLIAGILISGCSTVKKTDKQRDLLLKDQQILEARFNDLMFYRKTNQVEKIYNMTPPKYRKTISLDQFKEKAGVTEVAMLGYTIQAVEITGDEAVIWHCRYVSVPGTPVRNFRGDQKSYWVKEDGEWYADIFSAHIESIKTKYDGTCGSMRTPETSESKPAPGHACGH